MLSLTKTDGVAPTYFPKTAQEVVAAISERVRSRKFAQNQGGKKARHCSTDYRPPHNTAFKREAQAMQRRNSQAAAAKRASDLISAQAEIERLKEDLKILKTDNERLREALWQKETSGLFDDPSLRIILLRVCWLHGVRVNDLLGNRRTKNLSAPRKHFCHLASRHTRKSSPEIGRFLGQRDHTTILYAVETWPEAKQKMKEARDVAR